jgi:large subunit ribosomal protein L23
MSKTLLLKPRLSEQSYALSSKQRTYVFDVPASANKHEVARAVTAQFEVTVESVNISNLKGKAKATVSLSGKRRGAAGTQADVKKAYVKLAKGNTLPIFAAIEEANAEQEAVDEKASAKPATKRTTKEVKIPAQAAKQNRRGLHLFNKQGEK